MRDFAAVTSSPCVSVALTAKANFLLVLCVHMHRSAGGSVAVAWERGKLTYKASAFISSVTEVTRVPC